MNALIAWISQITSTLFNISAPTHPTLEPLKLLFRRNLSGLRYVFSGLSTQNVKSITLSAALLLLLYFSVTCDIPTLQCLDYLTAVMRPLNGANPTESLFTYSSKYDQSTGSGFSSRFTSGFTPKYAPKPAPKPILDPILDPISGSEPDDLKWSDPEVLLYGLGGFIIGGFVAWFRGW